MSDFETGVALLSAARTPDDVFDVDGADAAATYRRLAKLVHPDRAPEGRSAAAGAAFHRLAELWAARHGAGGATTVPGARATYPVTGRLGADEFAEYFAVAPDLLLKLARRPTDNDLLRREATVLAHLDRAVPARHRAYLPALREGFTYRERDTGADRAVNVLERLDGFVSLATVRAAYPDGLDPRDAAWMWRRLLVALGLAHRAGFVHGAAIAENILIQPAEHGLALVNWCAAVPLSTSERVPVVVGRVRHQYAPEILAGQRPTPGSDIYLATNVIGELMPARPPAIEQFLRGCLAPRPAGRPDDAWQVLAELDDVLTATYGPRRFRPFAMPATAPVWPRTGPGPRQKGER